MAQNQVPSTEDAIRQAWARECNKFLVIAKDDQAPDFDFLFSEGAQSFEDVLWHAVSSIHFTARRLNGMTREQSRVESRSFLRPKDRAGIVAALEKAIGDVNAALEKKAPWHMVAGLGHLAEQYGKLVAMYRANNIVPPVSRK